MKVRAVIVFFTVILFATLTGSCKPLKPCAKKCYLGFMHDSNGCRTCTCCPVIRCPFCWRGYIIARKDNKCVSCNCKWGL